MKNSKRIKPRFLNRYTSLPVLLDMLVRKQIRLLSPDSWQDRNDAHYLERYRDRRELGTVLAVCFSTARETFHHWRVFTEAASGVCVEFNGADLLDDVQFSDQFRWDFVTYSRIDEMEKTKPPVYTWPFLKRLPYRDEAEFRVIFESKDDENDVAYIDFEPSAIRRITLSPWMPKPVADSVIKVITSVPGCESLTAFRSTLIENGRWKRAIEE